jgi:hypothetical protein
MFQIPFGADVNGHRQHDDAQHLINKMFHVTQNELNWFDAIIYQSEDMEDE